MQDKEKMHKNCKEWKEKKPPSFTDQTIMFPGYQKAIYNILELISQFSKIAEFHRVTPKSIFLRIAILTKLCYYIPHMK